MDRYLHLNNCIQLVIKSIGVGMACISIYSTVSWSHHYSTLRKQKKESCKLEQEINLKLRKGALVHVIRDRKLWFKCGFVSPFPHTVGYGYLQFNCLKEASKIEMPNSFWVIGFSSLDNINLEKYSIKEIIDFSKGTNHFFAIRYDRVEKV